MEISANPQPLPFDYSSSPYQRRHGPSGYSTYESYRSWLRDEFSFRCAYCLRREQWGLVLGNWDIEHFLPQSSDPDKVLSYDNLFYACRSCNSIKSKHLIPDPCQVAFGQLVEVHSDGTIVSLNNSHTGKLLIRLLRLDNKDYTDYRRMIIETLSVLAEHAPDIFVQWMRYPDDLPDLSKLRPPGGNTRPNGVANSYYAQRQQGLLPETY